MTGAYTASVGVAGTARPHPTASAANPTRKMNIVNRFIVLASIS
jgi:hypothetical protein